MNRGNKAARAFEDLTKEIQRARGERPTRAALSKVIGADYTALCHAINGSRPVSLDAVCDWIEAWNTATGDTLRLTVCGSTAVRRD